MLFYYVQTDMIPGVNIRSKASIASINKAGSSGGWGGGGALRLLAQILGGRAP